MAEGARSQPLARPTDGFAWQRRIRKAAAPRPNLGECVFLPTIQRNDVLESGAVEAPSRERDRYAGGDLLQITGLQYVDAEICHSSEADVFETRPTHRDQAQRIDGAK